MLAMACAVTITGPIAIGFANAALTQASMQASPANAPLFEVATVKPNNTADYSDASKQLYRGGYRAHDLFL